MLESKKYQTFISYKHGQVTEFSKALAQALASYASPLLRPPRKIFRDEDHIEAGGHLPKVVENALGESEYLILLASRGAAESTWVQAELKIWCVDLKRADKIIIIHVEDSIVVDNKKQSIDWDKTDALPKMLRAYIPELPLYVDLRWAIRRESLSLEVKEFEGAINQIVARFLGVAPVEMNGIAQKQFKLNRKLKISAFTVVALSAIGVLVAGSIAYQNFEKAKIATVYEDYNTAPNLKSSDQRRAIVNQCNRIQSQSDDPIRPPIGGSQEDIDAVKASCAPLNNLSPAQGGIKGLNKNELISHIGIQWTYNDGGARSRYFTARILRGEPPYEALLFYVQSHNLNHREMASRRPQCALLKLGRKKSEEAFCKYSDQKP